MVGSIGLYELLTAPDTRDSGSSRWCLARRDGQVYVLKEFLSPVYPTDLSPLSGTLRTARALQCRGFEQRKKALYQELLHVNTSTVVPVLDFFRSGPHYYAASEYVQGNPLTLPLIESLPASEGLALLMELCDALTLLNECQIVHGDIKPQHLLLRSQPSRRSRLALIDFDGGYFATQPPKGARALGGDPWMLAPECLRFLSGEEVDLTPASDWFALGLLLHLYLSGEWPQFDPARFRYPCEASLSEGGLTLSSHLPATIRLPVRALLSPIPAERPDPHTVREHLNALYRSLS